MLTSPPLSLYVHFPWCVRKCPYCDFNSYTLHGELAEHAYVQRLLADLEAQSAQVPGRSVHSVFFGGGTPSLFSAEALARLLEGARRHLAFAPDAEITLEANPGTIERGAFHEYRAAGITRVSLGAQSFDGERLKSLGRIHSAEETRAAAAELHAAGLDNFNLDLMYALPGQSRADAVADVQQALRLAPAHLSHYQLTLEPGTPFAAAPPPLPDEDVAAEMLSECLAVLEGAGFAQYEVSAYARAGRQCVHNLNYWKFGDYLGIGAGAHGKLTLGAPAEIVRTVQPREPRRYLAAPPGTLTRRAVPEAERAFEFMLNALRLCAGFTLAEFTSRTGLPLASIAAPLAAALERGLVLSDGNTVRASALGLRFLNETLLLFMAEKAEMAGDSALSIARHEVGAGNPAGLFTASGGAVAE
jgi:putative oxygen-independent coproporphyrinogen III oxidase